MHELLTSETPFLESDEPDGVSGFTEMSSTWEPEFDMNAFFAYCGGMIDFPIEVLQKSQASEEKISFVKSLLTVVPKARPTATAALQNPWLAKDRYKSDWYDNLERGFSVLGVDLKLGDKEKGILMRTTYKADIMRFLPPSTLGRFLPLLQQAIAKGLDSVALMLLSSPTNRRISHSARGQLLHQAIESRLIDVMKLILTNKTDVDVLVGGRTALQVVAERGDIDMVRLLLENKADINGRGSPYGNH